MSEEKINALELIHDHLIDERVLNIVIDKRESAPSMKSLVSSSTVGDPYTEDDSKLLLIAPMGEVPALTVAEIYTRKSFSDENGKMQICIFSHLLKLLDVAQYQKQGGATEMSLNLEDPSSLDVMLDVLGQLIEKYNEFGKLMNKVGTGLLQDYIMWSEMEFRPTQLRR